VSAALRHAAPRAALLVATQELLFARPAGGMSVRDIAARARVTPDVFHTHFDSVEHICDEVCGLFAAEHARLLEACTAGVDDPAAIVALRTRQTLRFVRPDAGFGRLVFDAGLPVDSVVRAMREQLEADILRGIETGVFAPVERELVFGMVVGSILGVALDLHRGAVEANAIERATAQLLRGLGVSAERAEALAFAPHPFVRPPALPLRPLEG
jgi:AcrR family transcriptional regulator